jgi:hypothetical protein
MERSAPTLPEGGDEHSRMCKKIAQLTKGASAFPRAALALFPRARSTQEKGTRVNANYIPIVCSQTHSHLLLCPRPSQ